VRALDEEQPARVVDDDRPDRAHDGRLAPNIRHGFDPVSRRPGADADLDVVAVGTRTFPSGFAYLVPSWARPTAGLTLCHRRCTVPV
jgi:hypothetical protein